MEPHDREEPLTKKPRMEEHNLNGVVGVKLVFNFYYHRSPFQGALWEKNYGLRKKDIKYVNLIFVRAEEVSDIPAFTEYERALIKPYCGVRLDFFKDGFLNRSECVDFTEEPVELRDVDRYDRMRIKLIKYDERVRESLDDDDILDVIGDDDAVASLYSDYDSSECSSDGGGRDAEGLIEGLDEFLGSV